MVANNPLGDRKGSSVQTQPSLHMEFQISLVYMKPPTQNTQKNNAIELWLWFMSVIPILKRLRQNSTVMSSRPWTDPQHCRN